MDAPDIQSHCFAVQVLSLEVFDDIRKQMGRDDAIDILFQIGEWEWEGSAQELMAALGQRKAVQP